MMALLHSSPKRPPEKLKKNATHRFHRRFQHCAFVFLCPVAIAHLKINQTNHIEQSVSIDPLRHCICTPKIKTP